MATTGKTPLGTYLKACRTRLDPATLGFATGRRRTPGLRREEVAQLSHISATWYTWLEQGRGGAPSVAVLNRIATGLMLTEPERAHLFMLARGHLPDVRFSAEAGIEPRLQRLLDTLEYSPALIRTATWDVVAWNRAAAAVLHDYSLQSPSERNILRQIFSRNRTHTPDDGWEGIARFVVGAFRADVTRAGADAQIVQLVEELSQLSPVFAALWQDNDIPDTGGGTKRLHHHAGGPLELDYCGFAVDGRPDLRMIVYTPATPADVARVRELMAGDRCGADSKEASHATEPGMRCGHG
jgi:transcriptional regulator with XRE-family HTH domain